MAESEQSITRELEYLLPTPSCFWQWSADGKWVEWVDGRTIVHRDQLAAVVERLVPRGLPPLGAILLLLAACRPNWDAEAAKRHIVTAATQERLADGLDLFHSIAARRLEQELSEVLGDLGVVAGLPEKLRDSLAAQASLAEYVFDGALAAMDAVAAKEVAAILRVGLDSDTLKQVRSGQALIDEMPELLQSLEGGLSRVAVEPVATWLKTGVSAAVLPAEIEVPLSQRVRELMTQLQNDEELGSLASVARDLLAALHVPRRLVSHEDLPLGGVSDISNRGSLDRLLVSELANDDLTLTIRVALGEAMYLRREAPAHRPQVTRHLLIDCGIRMWGIPRLFATAVGLAVAAVSDDRTALQMHRAAGPTVLPCDLTSRQGVLDHLAELRPEPDPLPALRRLLTLAADDASEEAEVFLVTHEDAVADVGTLLLNESAAGASVTAFIATVSREGQFVLWRWNSAGRQEISRVQLSVEKLFPATPAEQIELLTRDASFPMILRRESLPLRLPAVIKPRQAIWLASVALVAVTSDHRLMAWTDQTRGGLQLTDAIPPGAVLAVLGDADRPVVQVVTYVKKTNTLTILSSNLRDPCRRRSLRRNKPLAVVLHQGRLLLMYGNEVRVVDPETGEESNYAVRSDIRHKMGRFYCGNQRWFAAGISGLEVVCPAAPNTIALFDRPGHGPWKLLKDFAVQPADSTSHRQRFSPTTGTALPAIMRSVAASADGNFLVVEGKLEALPNGHISWWMCNLLQWTVLHIGVAERAFTETLGGFGGESVTNSVNLRRNFHSIGRDRKGRLTLLKGDELFTLMENASRHLIWAHAGCKIADDGISHVQQFHLVQSPEGTRYKLRKATWPDGSQAWLDSRGMLHLVSSDRRVPQITFTLGDQPSAGWTSNGQTFGWKYFVDDSSDGVATAIEQMAREFVARLAS